MEATLTQNQAPVTEAQKEKARLRSLDIMKGFLILVVVIYHIFGLGNYANSTYDFFGGVLGAFFFIAGYCYARTASYKEIIIKRTKRLMIPTLIAMVIIFLVMFAWEAASGQNPDFVAYLKSFGLRIIDPYSFQNEMTYYPDTNFFLYCCYAPLWFVFRLYLTEIIFYAIRKVALKNVWSALITVAICLTITQIYRSTYVFANQYSLETFGIPTYAVYPLFQIDMVVSFVGLMVVGAYLKNINFVNWIENGYKSWKYWVVVLAGCGVYALCVIFLSIYMGDLIYGGWITLGDSTNHYMVYAWFLCQCAFAFVTIFVCSWVAKIKYLREIFIYLGKHTLFILAFHTVVGVIFARFFGPTSNVFITGYLLELLLTPDPYSFVYQGLYTAQNWVLVITFFVDLALCIGFQHIDNRIRKCIGIAIKNHKAKKEAPVEVK